MCVIPSLNSINTFYSDFAPFSSLANIRSVLVQCETEFQVSNHVETILIEHDANITKSGTSKQHFQSFFIGVGRFRDFFNAVSDRISEVLL